MTVNYNLKQMNDQVDLFLNLSLLCRIKTQIIYIFYENGTVDAYDWKCQMHCCDIAFNHILE